jgi:hypothetical protein
MADEEASRGSDFNKQLTEIEFQALRVREIEKHPRDVVGDILQQKSLDLLGAMVGFFSSSLVYFRHGFFCTKPLFNVSNG